MPELVFTDRFDRVFRLLSKDIRDATYEKLTLYLENPASQSLRIAKVENTPGVWAMTVTITMNYRLTFQLDGERVLLRTIGTHDVLRQP